MSLIKHGSLFSGIGGFDLAAEWMGWENLFHCEWEEFPRKVLKYYWPNAESYGDIKQTDFTIWRGRIDILTGGFPCQPYSNAGKRKGKEDERHLWPEMLRAIREIQPKWIVGENVRGLINWNGGMVFDEVQSDLEAEGYKVLPVLLPACAVNAPHRRDRIWFVAYSYGSIKKNNKGANGSKEGEIRRNEKSDVSGELSCNGDAADTDSRRLEGATQVRWNSKHVKRKSEFRNAPESDSKRQQKRNNAGEPKGPERKFDQAFLSHEDWQNFPTQSPVCNGDDGLSSRLDNITFPKWRNESIKAGGNAIVPQVAYEIFKIINELD